MMYRIFSRVTLNKRVLNYNFCIDIRASDGCRDRHTIEVIQSKAMLKASLPRSQRVNIPLKKYDNAYTFKRHQRFCHTPASVYATQNFLWDKNHSIISRINLSSHSYNSIRHFSLHDLFAQPDDVNIISEPQRNFIINHISTTFPVEILQGLMVKLHDWVGLSWWTTILVTTTLIQIASLPAAIHEQIILERTKNAYIEHMKKIPNIDVDSYILAQKHMWAISEVRKYQRNTINKQWVDLKDKHNCQPSKLLVLKLMNIFGPLVLTVTLGNLFYMYPKCNYSALTIHHQLSQEGFGWINNLLQADPYYILPLICFTTGLTNLWLHQRLYPRHMKTSKMIKYIYPGFYCIFLPVLLFIPSGFTYTWSINNILRMGKIFLLAHPPFRKLVGLPECVSEQANSKSLHNTIKSK